MDEIRESLRRIEEKTEIIQVKVANIQVDTAKNTVSLEHHMQRTSLNEARIKYIENWILGILTSVLLVVLGVLVKLMTT